MVLKRYTGLFFLGLLLTVTSLLLTGGCDDEVTYQSVDCADCIDFRPDSGTLIIKLTIDGDNPAVPVNVFRDRLEYNDLRYQDTVSESELEVLVPLNYYYTVTAEYHSGNDTILVVDGDQIETKKAIGQCETVCWIITGGLINVEYRKPD